MRKHARHGRLLVGQRKHTVVGFICLAHGAATGFDLDSLLEGNVFIPAHGGTGGDGPAAQRFAFAAVHAAARFRATVEGQLGTLDHTLIKCLHAGHFAADKDIHHLRFFPVRYPTGGTGAFQGIPQFRHIEFGTHYHGIFTQADLILLVQDNSTEQEFIQIGFNFSLDRFKVLRFRFAAFSEITFYRRHLRLLISHFLVGIRQHGRIFHRRRAFYLNNLGKA